jgi:hypothetical protein
MRDQIDPTTCVEFIRWFNPITGGVLLDRNVNGLPYTVLGTPFAGTCAEPCKPERIAVEPFVHVAGGGGAFVTPAPPYGAATIANDIATEFPGATGIGDLFIHAVFDQIGNSVGADLVSPFTGSAAGVPATNITAIQAMLDMLVAVSTSPSDPPPIYNYSAPGVVPGEIVVWQHPTYTGTAGYVSLWGGPDPTPATYTGKPLADQLILSPVVLGAAGQVCTPVEKIKTLLCDGTISYAWFADAAGMLVDAAVAIPGFDEANIQSSCPPVVPPPTPVVLPTASLASEVYYFPAGTTIVGLSHPVPAGSNLIDVYNVTDAPIRLTTPIGVHHVPAQGSHHVDIDSTSSTFDLFVTVDSVAGNVGPMLPGSVAPHVIINTVKVGV